MTNEEAKGNLIHAIRWNCMPEKEALDMAIRALEQPSVTDFADKCKECGKIPNEKLQARWIPVSERLPEDGRPVLIYAWNVHHVVARYDIFRTENGYKKCWVMADAWNGNTEIKHAVIAWMPMSTPYEEGGIRNEQRTYQSDRKVQKGASGSVLWGDCGTDADFHADAY